MESTESEYKVERWDVVYDEKSNMKRPMLYIVPDTSLIEFTKLNPDLHVTMKGTGIECYDNISLKANLVSCAETRPNLFDSKGYYVVMFKDAIWLGYPRSFGTISFQGVNKFEVKQEPEKVEKYESTAGGENLVEGFCTFSNVSSNTNCFLIILFGLFVVLFIVRIIINRK